LARYVILGVEQHERNPKGIWGWDGKGSERGRRWITCSLTLFLAFIVGSGKMGTIFKMEPPLYFEKYYSKNLKIKTFLSYLVINNADFF
jgi:hypothetical protein